MKGDLFDSKEKVETAFQVADKAINNVKKQLKHYSGKRIKPQYRITRGRLGATYVIATCAYCGQDVGKRPVSDQAFKSGNTEALDKALTFLKKCESCGLFVCRKHCWTREEQCQKCAQLKKEQ